MKLRLYILALLLIISIVKSFSQIDSVTRQAMNLVIEKAMAEEEAGKEIDHEKLRKEIRQIALRSNPQFKGNSHSEKALHFIFNPKGDLMYDFDTPNPMKGITVLGGQVSPNNIYYLSAGGALEWNYSSGDVLEFDLRGIEVLSNYQNFYVGMFQKEKPADKSTGIIVEVLGEQDEVLESKTVYLHYPHWHVLRENLRPLNPGTKLIKLRLTIEDDSPMGTVYLDDIFFGTPGEGERDGGGFSKWPILEPDPEASLEDLRKNYPAKENLTDEEIVGMQSIEDRVQEGLAKENSIEKISDSEMSKFTDLHKKFFRKRLDNDIVLGHFNPGYYYSFNPLRHMMQSGGVGGSKAIAHHVFWYQHEELMDGIEELGRAYYTTKDSVQKETLGAIMKDLVDMALTYGTVCIGDHWGYFSRGFTKGILLAKDYLKEHANMQRIASYMLMPEVLYNDHTRASYRLNKYRIDVGYVNADYINTHRYNYLIPILLQDDSPEKARDLYQLSSFLSNAVLNKTPGVYGGWKPDGTGYHHWGHRYGNYSWTGMFNGTTALAYFLGGTVFEITPRAHVFLQNIAKARFFSTTERQMAGSVPGQFRMDRGALSYGLMATLGDPEGQSAIDSLTASYYLRWIPKRHDRTDYHHSAMAGHSPLTHLWQPHNTNDPFYNKFVKAGIKPAKNPQGHLVLPYASQNIHRRSNWVVYLHGVSDEAYFWQYRVPGMLFYNLSAIALFDGITIPDNEYPGYDMRLGMNVTSPMINAKELESIYYERGNSSFVGGVSISDKHGMFAMDFDSRELELVQTDATDKMDAPPIGRLRNLRFKKSFFCFNNDIVCLATGLSADGEEEVRTGLFQEALHKGNEYAFVDGESILYHMPKLSSFSSDINTWVLTTKGKGFYVFPGQSYTIQRQMQSFPEPRLDRRYVEQSGKFFTGWINHGQKPQEQSYAYIWKVKTDAAEMPQFAEKMKSDNAPYEIIRQDSIAHIVQAKDLNITAYAIFNADAWSSSQGVVDRLDTPALLMIEHLEGGAVKIALANPDLNFSKNEHGRRWWSEEVSVRLTLKGSWEIIKDDSKNTLLESEAPSVIERSKKETILQFHTIDGQVREVMIQEKKH